MPRRALPADHPPFAHLPVTMITVGPASEQVAVHVAGALGPGRVPLVALSGYNRNMADHADFVRLARQLLPEMVPVVLVDLKGRGRSSDRRRAEHYSSVIDAADLIEVARALAIERAIFLRQD